MRAFTLCRQRPSLSGRTHRNEIRIGAVSGRGGVCVILSGIRAIWASAAWEEELVAPRVIQVETLETPASRPSRYPGHLINGGKNMSFAIKKMKRLCSDFQKWGGLKRRAMG